VPNLISSPSPNYIDFNISIKAMILVYAETVIGVVLFILILLLYLAGISLIIYIGRLVLAMMCDSRLFIYFSISFATAYNKIII